MSSEKTITKTLKFIIKTDARQEAILNKLTARHTYAITLYTEIIEQDEDIIIPSKYGAEGRLDCLTIPTKNHTQVKHDLKKVTGLNTVDLQCCGRRALSLWRGYKTRLRKWEKYRNTVYYSVFLRKLTDVSVNHSGEVIHTRNNFKMEIEEFSETPLWRKVMKNQPSKPFQSQCHKPKKVSAYLRFNQNITGYTKNGVRHPCKIEDGKIFIKISTLKEREPIELELVSSAYHLSELSFGRLIGGKLIKNLRKKRWEFHAGIKRIIPQQTEEKKKAIIGIDLGIKIDATVVVLLEHKKLTQDRIFFFREPDIRRRKFTITQRRKVLQKIKDTLDGREKRNAIKELMHLKNKIEILTSEGCHKIAQKVALIVKDYIEQGYEPHVAIGKLKGLNYSAKKGNEKGKKYRGRINSFPFKMQTQFIKYKCQEIGVKTIGEIKEHWTSRTCHRCNSKNTSRPTQSQIVCKDCGLHYNADVNGAINIAKRYWSKKSCSNCKSMNTKIMKIEMDYGIYCYECETIVSIKENVVKNSENVAMIFLPRKSEGVSKSVRPLLNPQGTRDSPSGDESTEKVEETG